MQALLKHAPIRFQILLAMLFVGGLTLGLVTAQSLHCARMGLVETQKHAFGLYLGQQRLRLEDWIAEREAAMQRIAEHPEIVQVLRSSLSRPKAQKDLRAMLNDIQRQNQYIEAIAIYDSNGKPVATSSSAIHDAASLMDEDMERAVLRQGHEFAWGEHPHIHGADYMALHAAVPVGATEDERVAGCVAFSVRVELAVHGLQEGRPANSSVKSYVIDLEEKTYLSVPDGLEKYLGREALAPVERLAADPVELVSYTDPNGRPVIGMATVLPQFGWLLVVEMDKDEAFSMLAFLLRRASLTGIVVGLLIIVIGLFAARLVSQPLQNVTHSCKAIAKGGRGHRLSSQTGREANDLASAFNTMLDRLETTQKELVQAGALAAVGELSASIVHEMRNPLNTIQINLQAIERKLQDDPKYEELFQLAERQTRRLQGMLSNLLDFSKPMSLEQKREDIRKIVEQALEVIGTHAADQHISLRPRLPDHPVWAVVDSEHLLRCMVNLIDNAIQVQEGGGIVEVVIKEESDQVTIDVTDQGPGIPDNMHEKVFLPFFTTRPSGTGLGLSIVKKIVDLHHGDIQVTSANGKGTSFRINLPGHTGDLS